MELGTQVFVLGRVVGKYDDGSLMVCLPDGQGVLTSKSNVIESDPEQRVEAADEPTE